jgi:hypothetical protein
MAISFVGSMAPVSALNGGNVTLTFTGASGLLNTAGAQATLAQNDVVVVAYACSGTADHAMSTTSTGWTEISPEAYANGTNDTNLAVYWKVMGSTPDTSFVAVGPTGASNGTVATAFAFRGVDTTTPLDVSVPTPATGTGTNSIPNAPSITPTTAGAWIAVIGAGVAGTGATFGHTDLSTTTNHFRTLNLAETIDIAIGMGIKTDWSSGAFDPAVWTGGNANAANSWAAFTIALRPYAAPAWTSLTTASVAENATLAYTCAATNATSYSIVGGADQADFEISGTTLRWASNGTQNYEAPADSDTNNTYVVNVRATGLGGTTDQTITVTVTDVSEGSAYSIANVLNTTVTSLGGTEYQVTKNSGVATGWDNAHAASMGADSGSVRIRFEPDAGGSLCSLKASPSASFSDPHYGFETLGSTGNIYINESGAYVNLGARSLGDVFWIDYDAVAGTVKYYKGAVFSTAVQQSTTRTGVSVTPRYASVAIYTADSTVLVGYDTFESSGSFTDDFETGAASPLTTRTNWIKAPGTNNYFEVASGQLRSYNYNEGEALVHETGAAQHSISWTCDTTDGELRRIFVRFVDIGNTFILLPSYTFAGQYQIHERNSGSDSWRGNFNTISLGLHTHTLTVTEVGSNIVFSLTVDGASGGSDITLTTSGRPAGTKCGFGSRGHQNELARTVTISPTTSGSSGGGGTPTVARRFVHWF